MKNLFICSLLLFGFSANACPSLDRTEIESADADKARSISSENKELIEKQPSVMTELEDITFRR